MVVSISQEIIDRFHETMDSARAAGELEPTAMVLATSDGHGAVTSRTVLLKALDARGFVFYTNTRSMKGQQLGASPRAAGTFLWKTIQCQVQLAGAVSTVGDSEADEYFSTRDRGSQVGAWASLQSQPLDSRETLERRVREVEEKYLGQDVPRPRHWSGFRIEPEMVEFWHGRAFRLHDRFRYTRLDSGQADSRWVLQRLYP